MYKPNELKQTTTGIYKRHPKLTTFINSLNNRMSVEEDVIRLHRYLSEGHFEYRYGEEADRLTWTYSWTSMQNDLTRYAIRLEGDAYQSCFEGDASWQSYFKKAMLYHYWSLKLEMEFHEIAFKEFQEGDRRQQLSMLSMRNAGVTVGHCIALGWMDFANDLHKYIDIGLINGEFNDAYDGFGRRRTQHFILRLLNSFNRLPDVQKELNIRCAYDVELFNQTINNWDTTDLELLSTLVIQLSDRHTHQCRHDSFNNERYYDFCETNYEYYMPVEILVIKRLRALRGLATPEIEHRLFEAPFGSLLEVTQPPQCDFLDQLLEQARKDR